MTILEAIVNLLRRRRKVLGWSLEKLSEESGVDLSNVSRTLGGKTEGWSSIERMARAMELEQGIIGELERYPVEVDDGR